MTLKIEAEDFQALKAAVAPQDTPERRAAYIAGKFKNADRCHNKDMRYRWDLLYASGLRIGDGIGIQGDLNLYAYLNDDHIDSALRAIVPPLEVQPKA